jgi:hypothetical protein
MRSCLLVSQVAGVGLFIERWCLCNETEDYPWFGIHGRSYMLLPVSGETDAGS